MMEARMMGEKNWVLDIKEKLEQMVCSDEEELWKKHSIYRLPTYLKDLKKKAYMPQVVSFGPYHYGDKQLMPMEEHKQRALIHFLKRTDKPIENFLSAMEGVEQQLRGSYEMLDDVWKDGNKFVQLMILDGCFMLEVLRAATMRPVDLQSSHQSQRSNGYAHNDPIFSSHGKLYNMPHIRRDMLMMENQLPLLVLEKLVAIETGNPMNEDFINKLILKFCNPNAEVFKVAEGLHVLDVVRKSMLQGPHSRSPGPAQESSGEIIRSAMELDEAGIQFRTSKSHSLRDIKFHHGILSLPVIVVDDTTESTFRNLMAFEQYHIGAGNEVTSYVFFMDNIIDSAKDVSFLHSKGIIQNAMGSDKAVAKLFNELSKDVTLDPESSLDEVHKMVHDYCKKSWNEWRANLIHTYFRSPWAALSLLAAIFLLGLTVAQTVYTIVPYYKPNDDSFSSTIAPNSSPSPL
ncbi:UPF0481 protein At3g47200-like [Tasmannia lanceolata]|uniref:UPF0481 protein At3g47200-like n=1 Tax=Tasmannia lanceolata TaxID=3420 RepID=UPI004063C59F